MAFDSLLIHYQFQCSATDGNMNQNTFNEAEHPINDSHEDEEEYDDDKEEVDDDVKRLSSIGDLGKDNYLSLLYTY